MVADARPAMPAPPSIDEETDKFMRNLNVQRRSLTPTSATGVVTSALGVKARYSFSALHAPPLILGGTPHAPATPPPARFGATLGLGRAVARPGSARPTSGLSANRLSRAITGPRRVDSGRDDDDDATRSPAPPAAPALIPTAVPGSAPAAALRVDGRDGGAESADAFSAALDDERSRERHLRTYSWAVVRSNLDLNGERFMFRLLKGDPRLLALFGRGAVSGNAAVRRHGRSVLSVLGDIVARGGVDAPSLHASEGSTPGARDAVWRNRLLALGHLHAVDAGVNPQEWASQIGIALTWTLETALGRYWAPDIGRAWADGLAECLAVLGEPAGRLLALRAATAAGVGRSEPGVRSRSAGHNEAERRRSIPVGLQRPGAINAPLWSGFNFLRQEDFDADADRQRGDRQGSS